MSQELGARHMVSAILMILVVITIILVLIFIVPIAKDFLSKDELSREKIDKLLEDFYILKEVFKSFGLLFNLT